MHIDDKELDKFQNGTMDSQDMIAFLEHLSNCDFCLTQMTGLEEKNCITAPSYLKEQILEKASSPEIQAAKTASEASRKMQMFYYSLRTAAGVLTALFLLFSIGNIDFTAIRSEHAIQSEYTPEPVNTQRGNHLYDFARDIGQGITNNTSSVTDSLKNFSNKLLNGGR